MNEKEKSKILGRFSRGDKLRMVVWFFVLGVAIIDWQHLRSGAALYIGVMISAWMAHNIVDSQRENPSPNTKKLYLAILALLIAAWIAYNWNNLLVGLSPLILGLGLLGLSFLLRKNGLLDPDRRRIPSNKK
jgi:hypothetical protein